MNTPDGDPHEIPNGAHPETRLRPDVGQIEHPDRVGRYRIEQVLGQGDFSVVYLAHDEQLDRPVALRVPHADLVSRPEDAASYLAEARKAARLDHPHIVPVHDVGSTDNFSCYVVSKYVEGSDLKTKLRQSRLMYPETAKLVEAVAEALHYAHAQGVLHGRLVRIDQL